MGKKKPPKSKLRPNHIRAWRKKLKMTQEQLSARVGLAQGSLSQLELSEFAYTQPVLERIAVVLGCDPWDLISRDPDKSDEVRRLLRSLSEAGQKRALGILKALEEDEKTA